MNNIKQNQLQVGDKMSTNDQQHAEVTEETLELAKKLGELPQFEEVNMVRDDSKTNRRRAQLLADFCAARESLLTASNEDLAAQVVKLTEQCETAEAEVERLRGIMIERGRTHNALAESHNDISKLATRLAEAIETFCRSPSATASIEAVDGLTEALAAARKAGLLK